MSTDAMDCRQDMSRVAIIILNWNGWNDTAECLQSLIAIGYRNYDIIVVDNGSTDDSPRALKEIMQEIANSSATCCPQGQDRIAVLWSFVELSMDEAAQSMLPLVLPGRRMVLIKCDDNYGFAKGNDIGIKYAFKNLHPDYILLLNSDTIVTNDFLGELVKIANGNDRVGSVQSLLLRPGGEVVDSLGQTLYLLGARDYKSGTVFHPEQLKEDVEIFGACAAAALYRSGAIISVGLLDEDFYIIYEDVDLSFRLRLAGYNSMLSCKSVVYHKRGISGGRRPGKDIRLIGIYHGYKNWMLLALRYYSLSDMLLISRKLIRSFLGWMFYAFKLGRTGEVFGLIHRSLKIRKQIATNSCIKEIREKWIKRGKP
jgi:GT2 family glycosyltransferase